ncbi:hypothetical protein HY992_05380 [Candidatus Micrarchaeota archaeon]|nr:hypothetical protein [Candidatus Micrarchaeota archaeon]
MKKAQAFSELGLTANEASLLEFLLSEGPCTGSVAAATLGLHKSAAYFVLERLVHKKLASFVVVNGKREYRAIEPEVLKLRLEERKKDFLKNAKAIEEISKLVKQAKKHALFKIFEGWDGMQKAFEDILTLAKTEEYTVFAVSVPEKIFPRFRRFIARFHAKRAEKNIKCRVLVSSDLRSTIGADRKKEKHTNVRFISLEHAMPMVANVYGDKVMLALWSDLPLAMTIESKDVSSSFKQFFNLLWNTAAK